MLDTMWDLTLADRSVGFTDQFHRECKVLQIVGEEAEGFELSKCDALQDRTRFSFKHFTLQQWFKIILVSRFHKEGMKH
jgi:hypothetical protein